MPAKSKDKTTAPKLSKKILLVAGGFILVLLVLILSIMGGKPESSKDAQEELVGENFQGDNNNQDPDSDLQNPTSQNNLDTLVYGAWAGQQSLIKSIDLTDNKISLLASLPLSVKKVNVLSPTRLLYIDGTDNRDHGRQIVTYEIKNKKVQSIIKAEPGFGIDDYAISPNKKYLAVWEVAFAQGSEVLQGGRSRVYALDMTNPGAKYLLFDETSDIATPVHYPQAVSNTGKVFADTFLPNDPNGGAGWAYGMSVVNFDGTGKQDMPQMQKGTYGTQPVISPDGKLLVFAGYDGKNGPGDVNKDGYRQAILTPNTVETLDTESLKRTKISGFSNANIYSTAGWGSNNNLVLTVLSRDEAQTGFYSFNTQTKSLKVINLPEESQISYSYVASLSGQGLVIGKPDDSDTSTGNLGEGYLPSLTRVYIQKSGSQEAHLLSLDEVLVQHITVLPNNYFQSVLAETTQDDGAFNPQPTLKDLPNDPYTTSREKLQLRTFELPKQELTTKRETQQSRPRPTPVPTRSLTRRTPTPKPDTFVMDDCTDLAEAQCSHGLAVKNTSPAFRKCVKTNKEKNRATIGTPYAVCSRSPLYLYGEEGQEVSVKIQTTVYNDIPRYNNIYKVKLLPDGFMEIDSKNYDAINYDYKSNARILRPPATGAIVDINGLENLIRDYAKKLGLNAKETADLLRFGKENVTSPYVFFSFYDQAASEQILPLKFYPHPDNYRNIVFYFKKLEEKPSYTPAPPVFPGKLDRTGFTAVEISEIVE